MEIRPVFFDDLAAAPEFPALIDAYARESAVEGMPSIKVKMENYRLFESAGVLHVFAALEGQEVIGFISLMIHPGLHYSVPVAVAESFFVAEEHRKGGAGLRLLAAAEELAEALGSPGLLVCAPFEGRLFEVLPRRGYKETNRVFFKKVGHVH